MGYYRIPTEELKSSCYKAFESSTLSKNHTPNSFVLAYFEFKKNYVPPKVVVYHPPHVLTGDLSALSWEDYTKYGFDSEERKMLGYDSD